jgi:hypothetical protein
MDEQMEDYMENHGQDHDEEIREAKEAMDMRDHFDAYGE